MLSSPTTVMVVDNDAALTIALRAVAARRGYSLVVVHDADEAIRRFREQSPSAVVLDVTPGGRGLDALAVFRQIDYDVPVLVVSGPGEPATVIQVMRGGAADFLCKPVGEAELDASLARLLAQQRVSAELRALRRTVETDAPYRLVAAEGGSMAEIARLVERLADSDAAVLLRGEPGTGKERLARAMHDASHRRGGPFVKVSCDTGQPDLLEASLFGFERGSMNGAVQHRPGRLEFASHGSIFFDEVAALGAVLHARLLTVLGERRFCREGARTPLSIDARVIAATSRDVDPSTQPGRFIEDLFLRLNVVEIVIPPLRQRPEDIEPLTDYFLTRFSVHCNTPRARLSPETRQLFQQHTWPGNVRELENAVRRIVVLGSESQVQREVLRARRDFAPAPDVRRATVAAEASGEVPAADTGRAPAAGSLKDIARAAAREAERAAISRMLQRTHWNRKEAAEILGISYKALLYKIKENGLDKPSTS